MDRKALRALTVGQQTVFDQTEHIGELNYLSAYEPLRNSQNAIIGYLNIPFYDRETELKEDISEFLVALINLYVFLFSLALLIAFAISGRITAPLELLQENLRETRLGQLKPLEWRSSDEFGELIDSYNRMLDQLQRSAEILAMSEREGAWKEMARQVAHEIKNPLTPMKLGIQHLQRLLQEETPDRPERINRICKTLVEQIDTLAGIASAFGDFARMPGPEMGTVDLIPILENTVSLYGNDPRTRIIIGNHPPICRVRGDKDQLLRIFGNLVKNALQAIPEGRTGEIKIDIETESHFLTVGITDNGTGIPEEQRKHLFVPNFTTKSGGTGLGLVMVKAMTEGMGGEVRFETEVGKGTTFFVRLPQSE
jgi:nitrogen fixation/metabolism regulation signal transduction histidine kinase